VLLEHQERARAYRRHLMHRHVRQAAAAHHASEDTADVAAHSAAYLSSPDGHATGRGGSGRRGLAGGVGESGGPSPPPADDPSERHSALPRTPRGVARAAAVSQSCACIGSLCLRQCVHGGSIGGGGGGGGKFPRHRRHRAAAAATAAAAAAAGATAGRTASSARASGRRRAVRRATTSDSTPDH
jgi:hypothetical protein